MDVQMDIRTYRDAIAANEFYSMDNVLFVSYVSILYKITMN